MLSPELYDLLKETTLYLCVCLFHYYIFILFECQWKPILFCVCCVQLINQTIFNDVTIDNKTVDMEVLNNQVEIINISFITNINTAKTIQYHVCVNQFIV